MRNSLLASVIFSLTATTIAQAAIVSVSRVITNTTLTTQTYDFSAVNGLGVPTTPAYMRGSVSIAITDFNRNGAILSADPDTLYTAWINFLKVQSMPSTPFTLTAPALGNNTYNNNFDWTYFSSSLAAATIEVKLRFTLSPGDQAAVTGFFEVSSVPSPAGSAALLAATVMGFRRRRYV
jgi:hypothetical protein